ncbi:MAG: hypothetical protein ACK4Z5_04235 [Brevundimonas sp.]
MKKAVLFSILAASAVALSTPAAAQYYGGGHAQRYPFEGRQAQLEQRVERLAYNGRISRQEYRVFQRQFDHFDRLQRQYRRGGIDRWEARELDAQLDRIQRQIRQERREDRYDRRW